MRCHYEVLALARDAAAGDVKKAFHRQALKWHPDKHQRNGISSDEATERFQEIQNAYEVLADPHERKWYDEHREQILRGDDGDGGDDSSSGELNLYKFFSASVFSGFGDDEKSFFAVYGALFRRIDELDVESAAGSASALADAPPLGNAATPVEQANEFYRHWSSYVTQRSFAWVDEYKTTEAPTRQIRRAMEKENKKLRDAAKKAFTTDVRELVEFVRKRDPRMLAYQKQKEKDREAQLQRDEQRKKEKQVAYEAEREAFQQQEHARWDDDQHATSRLAEDQIQEEIEKLRRKMDAELLLCDICSKTFKSDKQLQNHLTSKKHRDREVELGIVSEFDLVEDELDRELQAELEEMKRAKQQKAQEEGAINVAVEELSVEDADEVEAAVHDEKAEAEAEARREKERLRLEKEEKAAEKRRERKDARKTKKKEEVEKIVSAAKKKDIDEDEEDGRRGKGSRGKKKR